MSFQTPAYRIRRRTVDGMEGMHSKMFDPPTESPDTPDLVNPTNPVPEVMGPRAFWARTRPVRCARWSASSWTAISPHGTGRT